MVRLLEYRSVQIPALYISRTAEVERSCALTHHFYSKHVLNAQVAIRSPCCRKWFDCAECHQESQDHPLMQRTDLTFACKKCKKCFRKNAEEFEEADEYCPNCDNHFLLEAVTPKPRLEVEGEDARVDARYDTLGPATHDHTEIDMVQDAQG